MRFLSFRRGAIKDCNPVKGRVLFRPTFNKTSLGLSGDDRVTDDRGIAAEQVLVFREGVICIGRKYVASDARILMCIRRGCHCSRATLFSSKARSSGRNSLPYLRKNERKLHLIYWDFCTRPERTASTQAAGVSFYTLRRIAMAG